MDMTVDEAKRAARVLREQVRETGLTHSRALEIVAQQLGFRDWNTASAILEQRAEIGVPVPVLRILDEVRAREFYLGFLGFSTEWEHRFEPNSPLYMRVRRGRMVLDLSEHHGDGTPGSTIWVPVDDVEALQKELVGKSYKFMRPGIDPDAPGGPTMDVFDPFSNTIRFCHAAETGG
jgi:Glyoxalase superfamily protein